jgi:hypothetical protein
VVGVLGKSGAWRINRLCAAANATGYAQSTGVDVDKSCVKRFFAAQVMQSLA